MATPSDRVQDSAVALSTIIERAKNRQLNLAEVIQAAETFTGVEPARQRAALYNTWIAFNADRPLAHLAYFNYSVALRELGDLAGAINALRACCQADPDFGPARINLGRALEDGGDLALAVAQWREFAEACSRT